MKMLEELQIECTRLQRENTYLRQLLNLDSHTPLTIPEEKPSAPKEENTPVENTESNTAALSPSEKISLYRSLFRGCDDV